MIKLLLSLSIFSYSVCQAADDQEGRSDTPPRSMGVSRSSGSEKTSPLPPKPPRTALSPEVIVRKEIEDCMKRSMGSRPGEMFTFVTVESELADAKKRQKLARERSAASVLLSQLSSTKEITISIQKESEDE